MALTLADQSVDERTAYYAQQDLDNRIEVKIRSRAIDADKYQPKPLVNAIAGGALGLLLALSVPLAGASFGVPHYMGDAAAVLPILALLTAVGINELVRLVVPDRPLEDDVAAPAID